MFDESTVYVRVLLAGGHAPELVVSRDDPGLRALMRAVSANASPALDPGAPALVRLVGRVGESEKSVVFPRSRLIGVELDPPLVDLLPTVHTSRREAWLHAVRQRGQAVRVTRPEVAVCDDWLPEALRDAIFEWILAQESRFCASTVRSRAANAADDYDFRSSRVLFDLGPHEAGFRARLDAALPELLATLGEPVPDPRELELQVTAHGHLDRFKAHTDNASGELRQRRVSLVYYLHRRPCPFEGGELVLYDRVEGGERGVMGEGFQVVEPADNRLVAFQSGFHHQVRTVHAPGGGFRDGRFTVNTWLRDPNRAALLDPVHSEA